MFDFQHLINRSRTRLFHLESLNFLHAYLVCLISIRGASSVQKETENSSHAAVHFAPLRIYVTSATSTTTTTTIRFTDLCVTDFEMCVINSSTECLI